jgi:methionyl-tRNA formyltransferase
MKWKIAFLGTYHPAVPTLQRLAAEGYISIIILPRQGGSNNDQLIDIAKEYLLPWSYDLSEIENHDFNLILAANYPNLVPKRYLSICPCINAHWSLLPKYRGVHPTAWALLNQDYTVGVSVHWMEDEFDVGDIIAQETTTLAPDEDILHVHRRLADLQARLIGSLLQDHDGVDTWPRVVQVHEQAVYVPQRVPEDGIISWDWPTERIRDLVRALPREMYPGAFTYLGTRKLIIWKARPVACPPYFSTPGQVIRVIKGRGVWVKTADTCLELQEIQLGSEHSPQQADKILKRGDKLGFNSQLEIAKLKTMISEQAGEIASLRKLIEEKS